MSQISTLNLRLAFIPCMQVCDVFAPLEALIGHFLDFHSSGIGKIDTRQEFMSMIDRFKNPAFWCFMFFVTVIAITGLVLYMIRPEGSRECKPIQTNSITCEK